MIEDKCAYVYCACGGLGGGGVTGGGRLFNLTLLLCFLNTWCLSSGHFQLLSICSASLS